MPRYFEVCDQGELTSLQRYPRCAKTIPKGKAKKPGCQRGVHSRFEGVSQGSFALTPQHGQTVRLSGGRSRLSQREGLGPLAFR